MDQYKRLVGLYAYHYLLDYLEEASVIGLGTGSTIKYFIDELLRNKFLNGKEVVVSSQDTLLYLYQYGVKPYTPHIGSSIIDLYVDGFDEMSNNLDLVKGRGAALFWEKQLALRSKFRIYIGDYTKINNRDYLYLKPVPIEVSPPTLPYVTRILRENGYKFKIRTGKAKDGPIVTDTGNYIIDLYIDMISDAERLDKKLKSINGVIETGLFPHKLVDTVIVAYPDNIIKVYEAR